MKWIGAAGFHFGYAAFWGVIYVLIHERWKFRPWAGGLGLAAFIHLIMFPRWVAAVTTDVERKPDERPWRMEVVLAAAPLVFGLATALLYGNGLQGSRRD